MEKIPPEILIYTQKVKKFLKENIETYDYFLKGIDEDLFFKYLTDVSIKNYKQFGDPVLSKIQFELLNKTIKAICVINKPYNEIWFNVGIHGRACLN